MGRSSAVVFSALMVLSMVAGGVLIPAPATGKPAGPTLDDASSSGIPGATARALALRDTQAQTSNETDEPNRAPTVEFAITPAEPAPGEVVALSAEASDPDGEITSYEWQVDGESVASGPTAEYEFAESGTHEVRLIATDDRGATAALTRLVTVSADRSEGGTRPITEGAEPETIPDFETEKPERSPVIPFLSGSVVLDEGLDEAVLDTEGDRAWTVFQFYRQPTAEELDVLRSLGYRERSVLVDNTYYAAIPPESAPEAIELESVRAIADVDPEWKLPPALAEQVAETDDEAFRVTVRSFEAIPQQAFSLGLERVRERTYRGELTATEIRDLQQRGTVRWIEPSDEPEPLLAESVRMVGAQQSEFSVDGSGVRVGVVDTGIEHGHPHFSGVTIVDSYDERDDDYFPEADNFGSGVNGHGTHVAGTIAGSSTVGGESLVGVAPGATLVVARGLGEDQFDRVNANGTDIISNSWGSDNFHGRYTSDDEFTDQWARDHPQSVLVVANGNWNSSDPREQFANTPAIAKNAIAVGALNDGSTTTDALNNVAWLNNMTGPNDGRQKPDINAPGAWIKSSVPNSTYATKAGTSMATPHVSGVVALYEEEYPNRNPDAAEVKAAMVATAGPVENPNPSERAQGYGAIDAHNMLYNNSYESKQIYYRGNLKPPVPTANTHTFDVASDAEEVVVSLSWLDPPGDPATTDTLVNDLDLYVGPASDPKRYSATDRDQSVNRLTVDNLSPSERGTQWVVTVEPHNMWIGLGTNKPRQDYDGKIRVVTEEPGLSVTVPDRIVVEPQRSLTESFEARIDATGAPVHGIRAFIDNDGRLRDCLGSKAHDDEHVVGTLSESYRSPWSERLCFDVPDDPGTYPVTTTVNYTDESGQTATIEEETVIEVAKPRVKLEPFERNVTVGEKTTYELVVGNLSGGVGSLETRISLDRPPIGVLTDFTVTGNPSSETVQIDPSSDKAWITVEADGLDTDDYGNATLGILEAEGSQVGKSNISVDVAILEDESGDAYPLRTQGTTPDPGVPSDGLLNVTRGSIGTGGITIEPPPIERDGIDIVTVGTPITIQLDQEAIVTQYDAEAETVEWTLGDGTAGTGLSIEHVYEEPGVYEIVGQVSLEDGRVVEVSRTVEARRESDVGNGTVQRIGFDYVDQGGSVNLEVNRNREYNESSFAALDGTTVGGVSVNVTTVGPSTPERGHVELSGPIETFAVGGQETSVDNIEFGPRSNPTENVTFDSVSPNQSQYTVGDSPTVDGVPAQIIDFTFTDGTVYQQGAGSLNTGTPQPPNGSAPSFFQGNTNLWFNVSSVVSGTGALTATRAIETRTVRPGESTTVTIDVQLDSSGTLDVEDTISPEPGDIAIVDSDGATAASATSDRVTASWESVTSVTLTYGVTVPESASDGDTFAFSGAANGRVIGGDSVITVEEAPGPPPINENLDPPTDPDNDGKFEDVNGDGDVNIGDVQALFANSQDPAVQNNVAAFDFNDDGGVNVGDVQALFANGREV